MATLLSGSLGSAADTCTPEEVVRVVGSNFPGGKNWMHVVQTNLHVVRHAVE